MRAQKLIKAELSNHFAKIDYNQLRLWKVEIPDDNYEKLANITLQDCDEPLPTRRIGKYFIEEPIEEHIHIIILPPAFMSTQYQEIMEQREELGA
ncbi:6597_t:CDS:2 [Entrophospora sp. SA101]|nr:6597_t:CDS:2 [Entrophospora sp. SA101]